MDAALIRIAAEIAPKLDRAIHALLSNLQHRDQRELEEVLWENKIAILNVLQAVAAQA